MNRHCLPEEPKDQPQARRTSTKRMESLNPCVGAAPCNKALLMPGPENTRISKRTHPRFTD